MKIFFYIAHLGSGGSERICVNMTNELIRRGYEVHIITLNLDKNAYSHLLSSECQLHSLGVSRIRYSMFPLMKLIRRLKPEQIVVFSHELLVWMNYLRKFHFIKTRIILRNQNNLEAAYTEKTEISPIVQRVLKATSKVVRNTDAIIAQCESMKTQLIDSYGISEEKITVIYNPVSREVKEETIKLRENHVRGHHIVTVGRLETQKNTEHLIRAFYKVCKETRFSDSTLEIVGEGYERDKLQTIINELDLSEKITMNGIRKDIENVYAGADVVALSSTYEGMPNVLIEAIAGGIPVVSYDCPVGPREIIVDGINGFLVENQNIDALAEGIVKAFNKNWDAVKIQETATKFDVKGAVDTLEEVLGSQPSIALYLGSLAKGGAERVAVNVSEYLKNQGWRVTIITKLRAEEEYEISTGITRKIADLEDSKLSRNRIKNLRNRLKKLVRVFHETNPDMILSFIGKNNFMAIKAGRKLHIPVVASVRSAPEREYKKRSMKLLVKPMFRKAAGIILQTQDAMNYFPKDIQQKAIILPNPLKPEFVDYMPIQERKQKIVSVGRMDDNKNQILLIHAFIKLATKFPEAELFLYGDGPSREKWEIETKKMEYADRIHFEGTCDHIPEVISDAKIFVLPSRMEGMPNALMEAMALGLAVISTDCPCGGPRELIGENENGILIPISSEDENSGRSCELLKEAIQKLLQDDAYRKELSEKAYQKAQEFRPEHVNLLWKDYLMQIMERN